VTLSHRRSYLRTPAVWLLGLAMIGLVLVAVVTYGGFRRAATDLVLQRDGQLTELSASRLQQSLEEYGAVLTQLARGREMSGGGIGEQIEALNAAAARLDIFDGGVVLLDGYGLVRGALPERPMLVARDWSERDFFRQVLGGSQLAVSDAQELVSGDPYSIVVAVPIRGEGDAFLGALAGVFHLGEHTLSSFYADTVRLRLGQSGTTTIVDGTGRILFDSESTGVGRFVGVDRLSMLASRAASNAALTQDESGRDVIASSSPVPGTTWTLIVEDDWSIVTQETAPYRTILMVAFFAALLVPPLGLALISRQRRFQFLEVRRPEHDAGWLKSVRDHVRPGHLPVLPGWQFYARQVPGKGGDQDFFDAGLLPDGRLSLSIGRISSGGVQAGVALASLCAVLASAERRLVGAREALSESGQYMSSLRFPSLVVRCLCVLVDPASGAVETAAAGVALPHLRDGHFVQDGPPLGEPLGPSASFEIAGDELRLGPGSLLVLLGPSMLEARDANGKGFVDGALDRVLHEPYSNLPELVDRIMEAFKAFHARSPYFMPDLTVIALERGKGS
jgi:hypothetical protein